MDITIVIFFVLVMWGIYLLYREIQNATEDKSYVVGTFKIVRTDETEQREEGTEYEYTSPKGAWQFSKVMVFSLPPAQGQIIFDKVGGHKVKLIALEDAASGFSVTFEDLSVPMDRAAKHISHMLIEGWELNESELVSDPLPEGVKEMVDRG